MKEGTVWYKRDETQAQKGMYPPEVRIGSEGTLGVDPKKTHPMTYK
jgi:hypothetical protein